MTEETDMTTPTGGLSGRELAVETARRERQSAWYRYIGHLTIDNHAAYFEANERWQELRDGGRDD